MLQRHSKADRILESLQSDDPGGDRYLCLSLHPLHVSEITAQQRQTNQQVTTLY